MRKLLLLCFSAFLLSAVYVTPLWGRGYVTNNTVESDKQELKTKEIKKKEVFTLYVGVEEAFNIDKDRDNKTVNSNKKEVKDTKTYTGWVTARVNIRKKPNMDSEVLDILEFNEAITYKKHNEKWAVIDYKDKKAYVYRKYISKDENNSKDYSVPNNRGFKSYMSYKTITSKNSKQYRLQKNYAYTGNHGIRMIHNRYCIALGTYFNAPVGTYVDLVLKNGTTISCIVAEIKSDKHTNTDNIATSHNGCITEFLVDTDVMNENAKRDGDISSCKKAWNSPVVTIKIYDKNVF